MNQYPDPAITNTCETCGTELAGGLCPRCLMADAAQATLAPGLETASAPPSLAQVAAAFPQLEVIDLIGVGGMGTVWRARQPTLNRFVALKLLPASITERDPAFAERFAREGQLLARLHHPNIVTVHDSGRAGEFFYLLMEYVDGVNLRQAMRASRFTAQQALAIVPKICDALQYAHEEGVLHRDIKPENILLDSKGRVKLVDFGIAKLMSQPEATAEDSAVTLVDADGNPKLVDFGVAQRRETTEGGTSPPVDGLTLRGTTLGTPQYMAPEQVERPAEVDNRADIYSLGVVFYELLTGELPVGKFAPPSQRSEADPRVDGIVQQAMQKERERRQGSVGEFRTQVDTILQTPGAGGVQFASGCGYYDSWEYKSGRTFFGLPLVHAAIGIDPATGKMRVARGVLAVGGIAEGIIAFGARARGVFAFGGVAIGVVAVGGLSIGLISMGGLAMGLLLTFGGLAMGTVAVGGGAVGWYAFGGTAIGEYAAGGTIIAKHAIEQVKDMPWVLRYVARSFHWIVAAYVLMVGMMSLAPIMITRWARRKVMGGPPPSPVTACVAMVSAMLSGMLGTLTWFQLPNPPQVLVFSILVAALIGAALGALTRKSWMGRQALIFGCISTAIWVFIWLVSSYVAPVHSSAREATTFGPVPPAALEVLKSLTSVEQMLEEKVDRKDALGALTCLDQKMQPKINEIMKLLAGTELEQRTRAIVGRVAELRSAIEKRDWGTVAALRSGNHDQAYEHDLRRLALRPTPPAIAAAQSRVFGPVVERVITLGAGPSSLYSVEKESYVPGPRAFQALAGDDAGPDYDSDRLWKWLSTNNVDFLAERSHGRPQLILSDMVISVCNEEDFDRFTALELENDEGFKSGLAAQVRPNFYSPINGAYGGKITLAFQTRYERLGMVQVVGVSDDPPGVNIRYKLVQSKP